MRKTGIWLLMTGLLALPANAFGQAATSKVAVIDMERAIVESAEGKKAAEKWQARFEARKTEMEKKQKELEEAQTKLKTQERALSDTAKLELNRTIEQKTTEATRLNEDAQKELEELRNQLMRPLAEKASEVVNAYAKEQSLTLVLDVSSGNSGIVYVNDVADITTEIIRRLDAALAKPPEKKPPGIG